MKPLLWSLLACGLLFVGCAAGERSASKAGSSQDPITAEEIELTQANNVYDLLYQLRPHWLRGRGRKSIHNPGASYPAVFINGQELGSIEMLSTIPVSNVQLIRFLDIGEATMRYGADHPSGIIEITTY